MDFFEALRTRRSVRKYQEREVDEGKLKQVLEAIDFCPSLGNLQGYEIVAVRDPDRKWLLEKASYNQWFISEASVVLVFLTNPDRYQMRYGDRESTLYSIQDVTVACAYAHLTASVLGLGSCWVSLFDEEGVRQAVEAPDFQRPLALLPIGYPAEEPQAASRRPLEDIVHKERLQGKQKMEETRSALSTLWERIRIPL